ncbi:MAG: hypothetical protein EXS16_21880 [Gemmataceae bacterium]|nr:hypothetical protein [Gemmataceae bacterium]
MPGIKLLTNLDPKKCLKVAWRTAQDMGYSLSPIEETSKRFGATKGNLLMNLIAGPLAPRSAFEITVESYSDTNEVSLETNQPWITSGAIGVSRVRKRADELLDAIGRAIENEGGAIQGRKEY